DPSGSGRGRPDPLDEGRGEVSPRSEGDPVNGFLVVPPGRDPPAGEAQGREQCERHGENLSPRPHAVAPPTPFGSPPEGISIDPMTDPMTERPPYLHALAASAALFALYCVTL